jgi:membrane protease YdiL (CAAX protease family)
MADFTSIGKFAPYALFAASLAVWCWVLWSVAQRRWRLFIGMREPVSWPALPVCATFLVAFFLPVVVIHLAGSTNSLLKVQLLSAASAGQILAIVGLLAVAGPLRASDFGCDLSTWRGDLLAGTAGYLASLAPVFLVLAEMDKLKWRGEDDAHVLLKMLQTSQEHGLVGWVVLLAVVFVPLAEELIYRVLLQGWAQSQMAPVKAIVFSSVIFCLAHQTSDVLPLAPLALILGYIYYRRRSYLAVVVAHALFNAANLTLAVLTRS